MFNLDKRIWLFLLGYVIILFTSSILFRGVELRLVRLGLTYAIVLLYILFIVSSHYMLIGLKPNSRVFNPIIVVPVLILLILINFPFGDDLKTSSWHWSYYLGIPVVALVQCTSEELIFRKIIFRKMFEKSRFIIQSAFISSILFGLFHLVSLLHSGDLTSVISQIMVSVFIGVFLCGLYAFSQNLAVTIIAHMIINSPAYLKRMGINEEVSLNDQVFQNDIQWLQVGVAMLFYLPYAIVGTLLLIKSGKDLKWSLQ